MTQHTRSCMSQITVHCFSNLPANNRLMWRALDDEAAIGTEAFENDPRG
jgi:hypothetical protein